MDKTTEEYKLKKKLYNKTTYNNRKNIYKMRYFFLTYPNIQTEHAYEITEYLRNNGEVVDDGFINLLQSFIIYKGHTRSYNIKNKLPKVLVNMMNSTSSLA